MSASEHATTAPVYTPFAQSPLWEKQRDYYAQKGMAAWANGQVPFYVTSHPPMAKAYAEVVLGFWRDLKAQGKLRNQPLYIIELGAGSGRFAYHFLLEFFAAFDAIRGPEDQACYVMTDFAPATINHWREQMPAKFKPFVERGRLDIAVFDAEVDTQLRLLQKNITLSPQSLELPPVVIANYVFDSLRCDLFFLDNERIYEGWLAITPRDTEQEQTPENNSDHPFINTQLDYQKRRVTKLPYSNPEWNDLIEHYAKRLPPCALLFPAYALNAIERLGNLHGGHVLLLSADRGALELKDLASQQEPHLIRHSSFSLPVNYHALGTIIQLAGGSCWTNKLQDGLSLFAACCQVSATSAPPANGWRETALAATQALQHFNPNDFYRIKQALETEAEYLTPPQMLAFLRLSHWDTKVFYLIFPYIFDDLAQLPAQQQHEWYHAFAEVWRYHLPIGEDYDLAYDLALLAAELNRWHSAIYLFVQSLEQASPAQNHSSVYFNLGIAHWQMASHSKAESYLVKALALVEPEESEVAEVIADPWADVDPNTTLGFKRKTESTTSAESDQAEQVVKPEEMTDGAQPDAAENENKLAENVELEESTLEGEDILDADDVLDEDKDVDDEDFSAEDDDEEQDDLTAEDNTGAPAAPAIYEQLAELRAWQSVCQQLLSGQTLQLPATSPANPKALYASLLGPHHALALYRLQRVPELAQLAGVECLQSTEHARAWITQEQSAHKHILAILHPDFGLIGVAALECPAQALATSGSRSGRFYYWIGEAYQYQGYGTQAMRLLHQLASKLGVLHIFSTVDNNNIASQRALAKLGYQRLPFELIGERPGYKYHHFGQTLNEAEVYPVLAQLLVELNTGITLAPLATAEAHGPAEAQTPAEPPLMEHS